MCYRPKHICIPNLHPTRAYPEGYIEVDVPCGHCLSCLKRRQTDYATRLYRECKNGANMWFVTLTYRDSELPLSCSYVRYDLLTGERVLHSEPEILTNNNSDSQWVSALRGEILKQEASSSPRYARFPIVGRDAPQGFKDYYEVTPSLNREDVRLWLKKRRIQFLRTYGYKADFRYGFCGEYGSNYLRPHYHMIILGLTKEELSFFTNAWRRDFGYVYVKAVPMINKDGSNARQIVARYVGKYVSKGKFDNPAVGLSDCQKGRLCNSKRFGTKDFTNEDIAYYRCYDLFGVYDVDRLTLGLKGKTLLSTGQIDTLVKEIIKRNHFDIFVKDNLLSMPMPRSFRRYIWSIKNLYYDENEKRFKVRSISPAILRKVSDYLRDRADADYKSAFEQFCAVRNLSTDSVEAVIEFAKVYKSTEQTTQEILEENDFRRKYFGSEKDYQ